MSTNDKPTKELEGELSSLLKTYSLGELSGIEAEYEEITDAELRGEDEYEWKPNSINYLMPKKSN